MQKHILYGVAAVGLLILFIKFDAIEAVFMFLLVGAVPGTTYSLPSSLMLAIIVAIGLCAAFYAGTSKTARRQTARTIQQKTAHYRKHLPRRRFSRLARSGQ